MKKIKVNGPEYHALDSVGKVLYNQGMPLRHINGKVKNLIFKPENLVSKVLSVQTQTEFFQQYIESPKVTQGVTVFNSTPTDQDAMEAITQLLRYYVAHHKFSKFEFVHPTEAIPSEYEKREDLYILTGIHHSDPMLMPHIRRWLTYPTGCQIWVASNAPRPFQWCRETLGITPDVLFSMDLSATFVG